jgi:uncharacterized membrane protein YqjE
VPATATAPPGPIESVRALGNTALDILQTRLELLTVEFVQERDRLAQRLLWGGLLLLLVLVTSLLAAMLAVALVWDTPYRLGAMAAAVALPGVGAVGCAMALFLQGRAARRPFDASLRALQADVQAFR